MGRFAPDCTTSRFAISTRSYPTVGMKVLVAPASPPYAFSRQIVMFSTAAKLTHARYDHSMIAA